MSGAPSSRGAMPGPRLWLSALAPQRWMDCSLIPNMMISALCKQVRKPPLWGLAWLRPYASCDPWAYYEASYVRYTKGIAVAFADDCY